MISSAATDFPRGESGEFIYISGSCMDRIGRQEKKESTS